MLSNFTLPLFTASNNLSKLAVISKPRFAIALIISLPIASPLEPSFSTNLYNFCNNSFVASVFALFFLASARICSRYLLTVASFLKWDFKSPAIPSNVTLISPNNFNMSASFSPSDLLAFWISLSLFKILTWVSPFLTAWFKTCSIKSFISDIDLLPVLMPLMISFNWVEYWGKSLIRFVILSTLPLISTKAFMIFSVPELILFLTSVNRLLFSVIASNIFDNNWALPPQIFRISLAVIPFSISRSRIFCKISVWTFCPSNNASNASSNLLFCVIVIFTSCLISVFPPIPSSGEQLVIDAVATPPTVNNFRIWGSCFRYFAAPTPPANINAISAAFISSTKSAKPSSNCLSVPV